MINVNVWTPDQYIEGWKKVAKAADEPKDEFIDPSIDESVDENLVDDSVEYTGEEEVV